METKSKQFTAIYSTPFLSNIAYCFQAIDLMAAFRFCHYKFNAETVTLIDGDTGQEYKVSNVK